MYLNLISPKGEKKSFKAGFLFFMQVPKIKLLLEEGWTCESDKDADILVKNNFF